MIDLGDKIEAVWEAQGFEKKKLPRLLEKFGLMYQAGKNQYIVPEHLPDERPYRHWPHAHEKPQLHFRYEFDKLLSDFQKLNVSREVKFPCEECAINTDPYFHKMDKIENAILIF